MNFLDLTEITENSLAYIGKVFGDFSPLFVLIVGVILGFALIEFLIEIGGEAFMRTIERKRILTEIRALESEIGEERLAEIKKEVAKEKAEEREKRLKELLKRI